MSEPIKTVCKGDKITKVAAENISRLLRRVDNDMIRHYGNVRRILWDFECKKKNTIYGIGRSKPCLSDVFDEKIGNNIAFMKAKLNANIKKRNLLVRIYNEYVHIIDNIDFELESIDDYIKMDLESLRTYNKDYLIGIEEKLGL